MNVIFALLCYNASMSVNYEDAERDPERYQILSNGAIYDHEIKKIAGCPGAGTNAITQATARDFNKTWEEQKLQATIAAQEGARVAVGSDTQFAAWSVIVGGQASLALDTGKGQTSTKAAEFVGKAAGFLSDRRSTQQDGGPTNVQVNIGNEVVEQLLGILRVDE